MSFREELVARALEQWERFGRDEDRDDKFIDAEGKTTKSKASNGVPNRRKETVEPFSSRVADYWLAIPSKQYDDLVRKFAKAKGRLDGTIDLAWSAAFISYLHADGRGRLQLPLFVGLCDLDGSVDQEQAQRETEGGACRL